MESIGIDVHKVNSQICIVGEDGEVIEERRMHTDRERLAAVLGKRAKARVLIEASTESEWVARWLEELGHEVIVADSELRCDVRDAEQAGEDGPPRCTDVGRGVPAGGVSAGASDLGGTAAGSSWARGARRAGADENAVHLGGAGAASTGGIGVRSGGSSSFVARVKELSLAPWLEAEIAPLQGVMDKLNEEIRAADDRVIRRANEDAVVRRLCTVPGVGVVTAVALRATLDEAGRFRGAHQVQCYLGLVPREMSSGEKQHRGRITKSGNARARWLLVEAAWAVWRSRTRVLLAIVATLPLLFYASRVDAQAVQAERGTLVVVVRWRLGIVVCADRRRLVEGDPNVAYRDDVLKIVPAPPFGLAVTYGTTVYGRQGGPRFDAEESVKRFAADLGGASLVRNADRLATQLQSEMAESLEQGNLPPPQPRPGEPAVFAVMLFALEQGTVLEVLLLGVSSKTGFNVQPTLRPSNQFVTLLGHSAVAFAIRGTDPRFQDLRNNPWLGGFLINPSPQAIAYVSKHDARQFGRSLIRATNERLPLLQETDDVSTDSDCAGLTRPDGFEWLPDVP